MSSSNLGQNQRFLYLKKQQPFLGLCVCMLSRVPLFATPWTVACWAPLSVEFSRQEYQRELPSPTPGNLPNSDRTLWSLLHWQVGSFTTEPPVDSLCWISYNGRGFLSSSQPLLTTLVIMLKGSINLSLKIYKTTSQEQN